MTTQSTMKCYRMKAITQAKLTALKDRLSKEWDQPYTESDVIRMAINELYSDVVNNKKHTKKALAEELGVREEDL